MVKRLNTSFLHMVITCFLVLLFFSCSEQKDMREGVVEALGVPDEIEEGGSGPYQYQLYFYLHKDINRVYLFRKSAPGCGGSGQWYVETLYYADFHYGRELYQPPVIQHVPMITAQAGKPITISAEITDDEQVISADLFYRVTGDADSIAIRMAVQTGSKPNVQTGFKPVSTLANSIYSAKIPASSVTTAGIEYYIEASDGVHSSKLPPKYYLYIIITTNKTAKIYDEPETTARKRLPSELPMPGDVIDRHSPVSP